MGITSKVARKLSKSELIKRLKSKMKGQPSKNAIKKKSDKKIEGSGAQSARPLGSIGKTKAADSPRGGTTGLSMQQARKKRSVQIGKASSARGQYDGLLVGVKRKVQTLIRQGKEAEARKVLSGTGITVAEFKKIVKQRGKI
tara:strand:- start:253 stop:678 length:426 start_codon:yes stop_codon:yes gene_type:complete